MPEVKIPKDLEPQYKRIVEVLYKGDEKRALQAAIEEFVRHELKRLPSGQKFEHLMGKRMEIESDKEGYSDKELSSAIDKLKDRKKRLKNFDFGKNNSED